ncbi:unnamed protein product [Pneumocystis jirovecii]|uniref:Uncharacterized protein n=1 Tax=Pneumocystis jirovecii TaxID=42068 RepID=L0P7Y8_PNEJI|nr:unnamed protein product [Pneumocystis jirovecii]
MKRNFQPVKIFHDDISPDFIIQKELSSPFFHETKVGYSNLQCCNPMDYESSCMNKQCIGSKLTQNNSLKMKPKNEVIQKEKIPLYKWKKKDDVLSVNNNIINYKNSIDNFFDTSRLEDRVNSISSSFSTANIDKPNTSEIFQTKIFSKDNLESIPKYEKKSEKIHVKKKNITPTQLPINNTKETYFTKTNFEKRGKIRIPSIFLNNHDKNSLLKSASRTSELNMFSQNTKINTRYSLRINKSSKDVNKKENSSPQNPAIFNSKKNSYNEIFALKKDKININSFQKPIKKRQEVSRIHASNLSTQNLNIENTKNSQKNKHFQISKKESISQLSKKPLTGYSSVNYNASVVSPENFSKNNKNIEKKSDKSFSVKNKIIIPPVFLLQKGDNNTNSNTLKKLHSLDTTSSNSTLAMEPINEKGKLYSKRSNNFTKEFKSAGFNESKKANSLVNTKQAYTENISFSQSKSIEKSNQNKLNLPVSVSFDYKYECKNNSKTSFEPFDLKKTKTTYSEINIPSDPSIESMKTKDALKNMSRHKHLVSTYQEAVNMSTIPSKIIKMDTANRTHPNKIIIPSVFMVS